MALQEDLRILLIENKIIIKNTKTNTWAKNSAWLKLLKNFCKNNNYKSLIKDYFSSFSSAKEAWHCLIKNDSPSNHICEICGRPVPFTSHNCYANTCSVECSNKKRKLTTLSVYGVDSAAKLPSVKEKFKNTCIKKYGVSSPLKNKDILKKKENTCIKKYGAATFSKTPSFKEKIKNTCLEKYGVSNVAFIEEVKKKKRQTSLKKYGFEYPLQNEKVKQKIKNTCFSLYGKDNYSKTEESKKKHKNTCLSKYNVDHYSKTEEYKEKFKNTCIKRYGVSNPMKIDSVKEKSLENHRLSILQIEKENNCVLQKHVIEQYGQAWLKLTIPRIIIGNNVYISNNYIPQIEKARDSKIESRSSYEVEIENFCKQISDCPIITNYRGILSSNKELDIYIPEKNVAIEFNGVYWHSRVDKNYHLNKTEECEKQGIRLIHVWEDLWISKKDIYKSIIASALGVYSKKIYARDCECREISNEEYRTFLENNHIQGLVNSKLRLGLFHDEELVQVAGWGKSRFKKDEYELHRMCSKLNTQIIGGFSKLIKHSKLKEFISYLDRSLFSGSGYNQVGFKIETSTPPSYFYFKHGLNRISRISAQKHKLKKFLSNFDPNLTEFDNMTNNGFLRIYDCGTFKLKYTH